MFSLSRFRYAPVCDSSLYRHIMCFPVVVMRQEEMLYKTRTISSESCGDAHGMSRTFFQKSVAVNENVSDNTERLKETKKTSIFKK